MIPAECFHLPVSTATHEGMRGKNNEDRYGVYAFQLGVDDPTPVVFTVICDGIGGHKAGEVAAELAVETIRRAIASSKGDQPLETLRQGIQAASQAIRDQAEQVSEHKGMGATCVCAWVIGDRLFMAYVGDSPMYLLRGDTIRKLSIDHTWIQEALDYGVLTPEQARNHPNQHVIRRYLGSQELPEVDFRLKLDPAETAEQSLANQGLRLQPGDYLVSCSDGLSDLVAPEEILKAVQTETRERAPQALVALANQRGGHDNITIIVVEFPGQAETKTVFTPPSNTQTQVQASTPTAFSIPAASTTPTVPVKPASRKSKRLAAFSCLAATVVIAVVLLLSAALFWYLSSTGVVRIPWGAAGTPTPTVSVVTPPAIVFPSDTPMPTVITPTADTPSAPTLTDTPWPTNTLQPGTAAAHQLTPPSP